MTRSEKIKCALSHRSPDGIPFIIHFDGEAQNKYSDALFEKYVSENTDASALNLYKDGVLSRMEAIYYGMGNHAIGIGCPWWDWYDLPPEYAEFDAPPELPKTVGRGSYEQFAEKVAGLKSKTDAYVLVLIYGSHFEKAYFARGIENFLADLVGEPEFAQKLLNFIIHKNIVMLENIINIPGIDGILLGSDWGSQKDMLMSPHIWRQMIKPGEQREYNLIKKAGIDVWVHSCGCITRILPDLAEMGVDVLNPLQPECMDINAVKREVGAKIAFWGGISTQQILPYGTPEEVQKETLRVADILSRGGGYITAPSQDIQKDVPFENIVSLVDILRRLANM